MENQGVQHPKKLQIFTAIKYVYLCLFVEVMVANRKNKKKCKK